MSGKKQKEPSALAKATLALDEKLEQFEELAAAAKRVPMNSQKNIERAANAVNASADCQNEVLALIHSMIQALNEARERNQATAAELQTRSEEVQKRNDELVALLGRFAEIGQSAKEISGAVTHRDEIDTPAARDAAIAELRLAEAKMGDIAERAKELVQSAKEADIEDLANNADSLRQQVSAARNKVNLLLKKFEERASTAN